MPESRVEFYAAMHVNGTSHHVHILTVDREGDWDSLLPKGKMEAARLEISSKAMAPLLREAYIQRDLAREAALDASHASTGTVSISSCRRSEGSRPPTSGVSTRRPPPR